MLFLQLEPMPGAIIVQAADVPPPRLPAPFECLVIRLPRSVLRRISAQLGQPSVELFSCGPEQAIVDPIVHALGQSLRPGLEGNSPTEGFVEHVASAIVVHLIENYGRAQVSSPKGGLTVAQLKRAKALLGDFHGRLSIERIAATCELSSSHFSRAFQRSTGLSPHRWQMNARVEHAKEILRAGRSSLTEVAASCGFADQSHFSRVFRNIAGTSPKTFRDAFSRSRVASANDE